MMITIRYAVAAFVTLCAGLLLIATSAHSQTQAAAAQTQTEAQDRHVGYYYPEPQIREMYESALITAPISTSRSRAAFAVGIALMQNKRSFAPTYHLFVKGARKEKLIIVATETGRYATHYQLRALLAAMTSEARSTSLFNKLPEPEKRTFLDFCKFMGFTRLTISNGQDLAIQFDLK
ncbi:MAG: hypothetical protein AAGB04_23165 [Pseudomonadota bacterium]